MCLCTQATVIKCSKTNKQVKHIMRTSFKFELARSYIYKFPILYLPIYYPDLKDLFRTCNVLPFSCTHLALDLTKAR